MARGDGFEGLDVEVARRFARDGGHRLELVPFRWPDLADDLKAARFDIAVGGITMRPERARIGTFTRPLVRAGALVLARPGAPTLEHRGVRLAVNAGGHLERLAPRLFPAATLVRTSDNRRLASLVAEGTADAALTDEVEADVLARDLPGAIRRGPFTRDAKAYLARDADLAARLDAWLRAREGDGTLAALRARWLGPPRANLRSAFASDLDALLALIDLRLASMPAVAAAKRAAGRAIEDAAQEARVLDAARGWAAAAGLEPEPVEALFRVLIDAGREAQKAFLARPWPVEPVDLEREARPALSELSRAIVARAAAVASDHGALTALDAADVALGLDPSWSTPPTRLAIARAILELRRHDGREPKFVKNHRLR